MRNLPDSIHRAPTSCSYPERFVSACVCERERHTEKSWYRAMIVGESEVMIYEFNLR